MCHSVDVLKTMYKLLRFFTLIFGYGPATAEFCLNHWSQRDVVHRIEHRSVTEVTASICKSSTLWGHSVHLFAIAINIIFYFLMHKVKTFYNEAHFCGNTLRRLNVQKDNFFCFNLEKKWFCINKVRRFCKVPKCNGGNGQDMRLFFAMRTVLPFVHKSDKLQT